MRRTVIKVRFQLVGFHCWPEAPDRQEYLRARHRHLFYFQCELEVKHVNREVEMHDFQIACRDFAQSDLWSDGDHKSCERIALNVLEFIVQCYPGRYAAVEVWEDNECGARVEREAI